MPLEFAHKVLDEALKQGIVPKKPHFAKRSLDEAADDLAQRKLAQTFAREGEEEEPMVDADALMLRWMEVWGEWPTRK